MQLTYRTAHRLYRDAAIAIINYDPDLSQHARQTVRQIAKDYCESHPGADQDEWANMMATGVASDISLPLGDDFEDWFEQRWEQYRGDLVVMLREPPPLDHDVPVERFTPRTIQQRETYLRGRRKATRRVIYQLRSTAPERLLAHVQDDGQRALVQASLNSIAMHQDWLKRYDAQLGDSFGDE
ncbi:MAG: hypothetical protein U0836_20575 [Pirellulales bacterium]